MNKTIKILIIVAIIVVTVLGVIAFLIFSNKPSSITAEEFASKMEAKGYTVSDVTSQFSQYSYVQAAYLANTDTHQIEFYVLSDDEHAIGFYNINKSNFETFVTSASTSTDVNVNNYSKYSLTTGGKYKSVSRIDNTVMYVDVSNNYQNEAKAIMDEFGY